MTFHIPSRRAILLGGFALMVVAAPAVGAVVVTASSLDSARRVPDRLRHGARERVLRRGRGARHTISHPGQPSAS